MPDREQEILDQYPWLRHSAVITTDSRDSRFAISRGEGGWWVDGVTFEHVDFSGLDLAGFMAIGTEFIECDFTRTKLKENVALGAMALSPLGDGGDQRPTIYRRCLFDRADLVSPRGFATVLGAARFEDCSFALARINGWRSTHAEFVGCRFEGQIRNCQFHGRDPVPFSGYPPLKRPTNEFAGNDFRRADVVDCEFAGGIDVSRQLWPSDPDYIVITDVPATMRRVELAIRALGDPDQQLAAREAIELRFRHADDSYQTTQLVRLSCLQKDCDDPTARALALALAAPQR